MKAFLLLFIFTIKSFCLANLRDSVRQSPEGERLINSIKQQNLLVSWDVYKDCPVSLDTFKHEIFPVINEAAQIIEPGLMLTQSVKRLHIKITPSSNPNQMDCMFSLDGKPILSTKRDITVQKSDFILYIIGFLILIVLYFLTTKTFKTNVQSITPAQLLSNITFLRNLCHDGKSNPLPMEKSQSYFNALKNFSKQQIKTTEWSRFYYVHDQKNTSLAEFQKVITGLLKVVSNQKKFLSPQLRTHVYETLLPYGDFVYLNPCVALPSRLQQFLEDGFYKPNMQIHLPHNQQEAELFESITNEIFNLITAWAEVVLDNDMNQSAHLSTLHSDKHEGFTIMTTGFIHDEAAATMINNGQSKELQQKKGRGTGYPSLLRRVDSLNSLCKKYQLNLDFKIQLEDTKAAGEPLICASIHWNTLSPEPSSSKKQKLLIIDDKIEQKYLSHQSITKALKKHKYQTVDNFESAIEILKTENFDLILIDRNFPVSKKDNSCVSINQISQLIHLGSKQKCYLSSTCSDGLEHIFEPNHILSMREVVKKLSNKG
jgi:hypothetical protein